MISNTFTHWIERNDKIYLDVLIYIYIYIHSEITITIYSTLSEKTVTTSLGCVVSDYVYSAGWVV
jgi:hypothetical protein